MISTDAFDDELAKIASLGVAGLEAAGLGILAKPSIDALRSSKASKEDKKHAKWETAGLGVLAAHPLYELGKAGLGVLKHASIEGFADEIEKISKAIGDVQSGALNDAYKAHLQNQPTAAGAKANRAMSGAREVTMAGHAPSLELARKPLVRPTAARAMGTAAHAAPAAQGGLLKGLARGAARIFR